MGSQQAAHVHTQQLKDKKKAGQSLIEIALALPIMLIMISGLIEFGFALNQYLNTLDAAREAARFATDSDPLDRDFVRDPDDPDAFQLPLATNQDCGVTVDFYMQAACIAVQTMDPVTFITETDDVVVSVFRVLSGTVVGRWPNCEPDPSEDCPLDASPLADTLGEWHLYGRGSGCGVTGTGNGFDDDGDGQIDDGCTGSGIIEGPGEGCDPAADLTCHPSRFTNALVEGRLDGDAPDSAVLLVEVFYNYPHVLRLPWITPFVPDPLPLHTYTILPLPAAEPSLTITGTVTIREDDGTFTPVNGATISLNNGMIAVTGSDGQYIRSGLSSTTYQLTADPSGTGCTVESPNPRSVTLGIENAYDENFILSGCIDYAATAAAAATATAHATETQAAGTATGVAGTATGVAATETSAAATATAAAGETATAGVPPTETHTPPVGCAAGVVSAADSIVHVDNPPVRVQSDGTSGVEVIVTLRDACHNVLPNKTVALSSSRGQDSITPASLVTDGSGEAIFSVRSTVMSPWDSGTHVFIESTFSATSEGVTATGTASASFVCVGGLAGTAVQNEDVVWRFINDSGIARRLIRLNISSSLPPSGSTLLTQVVFGGALIWAQPGFSDNPGTIDSDWVAGPDRILGAGATVDLTVSYNVPVTGSNAFHLTAEWDNTSGLSACSSNEVVVIR